MGEIFQTISVGLGRFVLAWIAPSLIALGLFSIFVLPGVANSWALEPVTELVGQDRAVAALVFGFFVIALAILSAYAAVPIYKVLEGYYLPRSLQAPLRRRQLRRYHRSRLIAHAFEVTGRLPSGSNTDDLWLHYPRDRSSVRATALGNALTAMESWSRDRYHLDSQTLWGELQAVSSDRVRRDVDEGRAPVDFFVASISMFGPLLLVSTMVGLLTTQRQALLVAGICLAVLPLCYRLAVANVLNYSLSVKAMINVGRQELAAKLGLDFPETLERERHMWSAQLYAIELAQGAHVATYNSFRRKVAGRPGEAPTSWIGDDAANH